MTNPTEITKRPWEAQAGDVIIRHPDHNDQTGEWKVTGHPMADDVLTSITYSMADGGEGVFVLEPDQFVTVRGPATYTVKALLTPAERETALQAMDTWERLYIAATVAQRFPEVFDAAVSQLGKANLHQTVTEATQS